MSRHVVIRLTQAEAKALRWAAGNMLDSCCSPAEVVDFYGGSGQRAAAARRAFHKLNDVLFRHKRKETK